MNDRKRPASADAPACDTRRRSDGHGTPSIPQLTAGAGSHRGGRSGRCVGLPAAGGGLPAGHRRDRPRLRPRRRGRAHRADPGGSRRVVVRRPPVRRRPGNAVLGVCVVLGAEGDAGAGRRADTAGGALGPGRPEPRADPGRPPRPPAGSRRRAHGRGAGSRNRPHAVAGREPAGDRAAPRAESRSPCAATTRRRGRSRTRSPTPSPSRSTTTS